MEKEKIGLNAVYDRDIFCNHIIPFGKDISPYDFSDFTENEFVIKNKSREDVIKSISGSGKNIVVKLDFSLEELVFKPYGTHKNLGGFLYYCDTSMNNGNGIFICILLNGLNEIWVGVDKSTIQSNNEAKTLIDEKISNEK